jgi:hypothetical protein
MKILLAILGIILLLPIALVVVGLIATTLIGGYLAIMFKLFWDIILVIFAVIIAIRLIKKYL